MQRVSILDGFVLRFSRRAGASVRQCASGFRACETRGLRSDVRTLDPGEEVSIGTAGLFALRGARFGWAHRTKAAANCPAQSGAPAIRLDRSYSMPLGCSPRASITVDEHIASQQATCLRRSHAPSARQPAIRQPTGVHPTHRPASPRGRLPPRRCLAFPLPPRSETRARPRPTTVVAVHLSSLGPLKNPRSR